MRFCEFRASLALMNDQIEKRIELTAPISRVWRALTDYREFGEWFRVKLDAPQRRSDLTGADDLPWLRAL